MSTTTGIDLKVLNAQLETKTADAERIAASFKVDDAGRFTISTEQHRDYVAAVKECEEVKSLIDAARQHGEFKSYLSGSDHPSEAARDVASIRMDAMEAKSLGDYFVESAAFEAARERGFGESPNITAKIEGKSVFSFMAGTSTVQSLGQAVNLGIGEQARRKMHIRDLFPRATTKAAVMYGVRETGWVNAAAQVKQRYAADGSSPATGGDSDVFGRAPKSKIQLTSVLYPIAEVKHSLDAHHAILDDEPRLKTFINTRMLEGVRYAEDYDLLWSVGDGERLTGIFNTPGVQEYTGLSSDKHSVQIRRAITKSVISEYDVTGIVLSPNLWEQVETEEDDQGNFRVAVSVALGASKTVWRVPVIETTAMSDSNYLLGSWGMGAQLYDRESLTVKVSTEHGTNFTDGAVTFLASERVALEVPRPESFVIGTWTTPA